MTTSTVPDGGPVPSGRRAELLKRLALSGRAASAATVLFHTVVAERQGLNASEEKALDLVERSGPLTAGELARQTGLAPASVTGLVTRLERKGFARRVPNPDDRRSVLIEVDAERLSAQVAPLFGDWDRSLQELYAGYTDEQLEVILHFLTEAARRQREATARLTDERS
jgi:DNA-binding MarR family transcriptional regulator